MNPSCRKLSSLALWSCLVIHAGAGQSATRTLVLLHTADEHSHLLATNPESDDYAHFGRVGHGSLQGGIARRATVLKQERELAAAQGYATLTLSSGDNMMGTLFQAAAIGADYRAMMLLGYDATCFGNHDLELGPQFTANAINQAGQAGSMIPILASNIHFPIPPNSKSASLAKLFDGSGRNFTRPIRRWHVITTPNAIRVGLIGIMGPRASRSAPNKSPIRFSRTSSGREDDPDKVLPFLYREIQPVVNYLRRVKKVDLVIALAHAGTEKDAQGNDDLEHGESVLIAKHVKGIDVILSGHTHLRYGPAVVTHPATGQPVIIEEPGAYGNYLGKLVLNLDDDGKLAVDLGQSQSLTIDDRIPPDLSTRALIDLAIGALELMPESRSNSRSMLERSLSAIYGYPIFHTGGTGDLYFKTLGFTGFDLDLASLRETGMARLAADALLYAAQEVHPGATQLAITVSGVVQDGIKKGIQGDVSLADLFRIYSLGESPGAVKTPGFPIVRVALSAQDLLTLLESTATLPYASAEGEELFVLPSGLRFSYDRPAPFLSFPVSKIWLAKNAFADIYEENPIYDRDRGGWQGGVSSETKFVVVMDYYLAIFAFSAEVRNLISLYDPDSPGMSLKFKTLDSLTQKAILRRQDGSEYKSYEALAGLVLAMGVIDPRYADAAPKRIFCLGVQCR
ncbi:MAG: 5'-nucleotidase C-terminal domain-containing protein [Methylococcaceae bacterium]|nr:5'-nucleotidase C-terminal domain-containing protein [Methylococcaceae bacterium]